MTSPHTYQATDQRWTAPAAAQPVVPVEEEPPVHPTVDQTPYVDFRVQVVDRMRRMATRFLINAWEGRFADPLAPHSLAYLYCRHDPRRKDYWQLGTAWQLWLANPEVRVLPQLLFDLHQHWAPRAVGPGFDIRDELAVGHDEHMTAGAPEWVYAGLAVISLDTVTGTWEQIQKSAAQTSDVPAVVRAVLTDGTAMVCQQLSRKQYSEFTVSSTAPLVHGTAQVHAPWSLAELQDLRARDTDADILRWAIELSDTLAQADNRRIDALRQAARHQQHRAPGAPAMTTTAGRDLTGLWSQLAVQAGEDARMNLGFPGATDITHEQLGELLTTVLFNNIGSPYDQHGHGRNHTRDLEVEVVDAVADLFGAPPSRWGYVTSGATEGTEHVLLDARRRYPDAVVYTSAASHYKIADLTDKLMMPVVIIGTDAGGAIDVADLAGELGRRRDRPAVIIAIAGTTITEAVDDVPAIVAACERLSITRRHIHVDAALSGLPLMLVPVKGVPQVGFAVRGVDSVIVSGHKFLSTLVPCGVLVYRQPPLAAIAGRVSYTGTANVTIAGSRSGHTTLLLYASLLGLGTDAHRERVRHCRQTAEYAVKALRRIGVEAARHPHAFTVFFPTSPAGPPEGWVISGDDRHAHIICMPQITRAQIDEFAADMQKALRPIPSQRRPLRDLLTTASANGTGS